MNLGTDNNFIGLSGLTWAIGIVESRNDPEKLGRVQVRCFGIHNDDRTQVPTEDLPWARFMVPVTHPGNIPNLKEGDQVCVMFQDGIEAQLPIVMGLISSNDGGNKNYQKGFTDPSKTPTGRPEAPEDYNPSTGVEDEAPENNSSGDFSSQVSSASSTLNYNQSPVYKSKVKYQVKDIPSTKETKFSEPENPYAAVFPYNKATPTESGHLLEFDDTPNAERVHLFHRTGSFIEMKADGSVVCKSIQDDWRISGKDSYEYSQGNKRQSVLGENMVYVGKGYSLEIVNGELNIQVLAGNANIKIVGDVNLDVSGNMKTEVGGTYTVKSGKGIVLNAPTINLN